MNRNHTLWFNVTIIALLTLFTTYVVLDTFVLPSEFSAVTSSSSDTAASVENTASSSSSGRSGKSMKSAGSLTSGEDSSDESTFEAVSDGSGDSAENSEDSRSAEADPNGSGENTDASSSENNASQAVLTSSLADDPDATVIGTYSDDNILITLLQYRVDDTDVYAAEISVTSPEYLQTALAEGTAGRNITDYTSSIAEENNAILAINGDYYGARDSGYVIRNGVLYRSSGDSDNEDLVIWADGSFSIISEGDVTAQELLDEGAQQVFNFGPALLEDGEISVSVGQEVDQAMNSNPRTAIGILDSLHYVFVVADGRTSESSGLSLYELADFMQSIGCSTAYNLDGGGSSTMVFRGSVINNPTSDGNKIKERSVSDIVYIGY